MKIYLLCVLLIIMGFHSFGQKRIKYSTTKIEQRIKLPTNYVVINSDTLFGSISKISCQETLDFCKNLNDKKLINIYKDVVFNNLDCGKYKRVQTKQWISDIIVYVDKTIPRKTRKEFENFYKAIGAINNLSINFNKKKSKSNYFITTTSENLSKPIDSININESYPYNHITYNLFGDNNFKFYSCILRINLNLIDDKTLIIKKLKQLFFISLGQFTIDKDVKTNSLLSYDYKNPNNISNEDLLLLKLHYLKIHDTPLNCFFYSKFIEDIQKRCNYESD